MIKSTYLKSEGINVSAEKVPFPWERKNFECTKYWKKFSMVWPRGNKEEELMMRLKKKAEAMIRNLDFILSEMGNHLSVLSSLVVWL